jgi:hypothetical protein
MIGLLNFEIILTTWNEYFKDLTCLILVLNSPNVIFFQKLNYLRYKISSKKVRPNLQKIEVIVYMKLPTHLNGLNGPLVLHILFKY